MHVSLFKGILGILNGFIILKNLDEFIFPNQNPKISMKFSIHQFHGLDSLKYGLYP